MNRESKKLTIFTPTYNRVKTLPRLYESLLRQENTEFEWLVVDDGSTDETESLIRAYQSEMHICIRYMKKQNGGKHTALNLGIQYAAGEYFVCVDSDDYLENEGVNEITKFVEENNPDGIIAYKSEYPSKKLIGQEFPDGLVQTTLFELINTWKSSGDRTLIYKTDIIRNIRIPEPKTCRFFPETYLYDRFDEHHNSALLRKSICCCEYLEGGYSANFRMLMIRNSLAMKWFYAERIDFPCTLKFRFQAAYRYIAYSLLAHCSEGKYSGKNRILLFFATPAGILMYILYFFYRRREDEKL